MALRKLRQHQIGMLAYARRDNHPALLCEMRLGKTLVTIRSLLVCPGRFLIIAPNSALPSWLDELAAEGIQNTHIALLQGTRKQRKAALAAGRRWNLINWEGHRALPEIATVPWYGVVADESTYLKNIKAAITKFYLKHFRDVKRRYILTGTINPESDLDMWCQLAFLDGKAWGVKTYWQARAKYYKPSVTGYGIVPRRGAQTKIREMLGARAFILRRKDCGADVPRVYARRRIPLPPKWRKIYNEIEAEFATPKQETKYAAARYHWLRQLAGGRLDGKFVWPGKLRELLYLLENDLRGEPLVVWFYYNAELFRVGTELKLRGYKARGLYGAMPPSQRRAAVNDFRRGAAQILLAQQAVAQMGANFSCADTAIYYSSPTGALARQQTEARIIDTARKTPHLILDLTVPQTVDEDAVDMAQDKELRSTWTLERARRCAVKRRAGWQKQRKQA